MTQRTIVVPVDFHADSDAAIGLAALEARRMDADVVLLHAIEKRLSQHPGLSFLRADQPTPRDHVRIVRQLQARADRLRAHGVRVRIFVRQGPAWLETIELAEMCNACLIVLGAVGVGQPSGLGDNAEKITRISKAPVLLARASIDARVAAA